MPPFDQPPLRVAAAPSDHVYVRHLTDPDGARGAECPSFGDRTDAADVLRASWIVANAPHVDVVHAHVGLTTGPQVDVEHWLNTVRAFGKPLVVTVHELPAIGTPAEAAAGAMLAAASAVITLTPGAAAAIHRRWDRRAAILPHPHVVDARRLALPRPRHEGFVVGVHLDAAVPHPEEWAAIETAVATVNGWPGARVRVDVPAPAAALGGLSGPLLELARRGLIELQVRGNGPDADLFASLQRLDASILPRRFDTHSWWLEACYDLGTTVIASDRGYHAEQRPCVSYRTRDSGSLARALRGAYDHRYAWRATLHDRLDERRALAQAHQQIYRAVVRRSATVPAPR